jgi:hypothetical protein
MSFACISFTSSFSPKRYHRKMKARIEIIAGFEALKKVTELKKSLAKV